MLHSEISPYSIAILRVLLGIMLPQEFLFAQYLTVEQPNTNKQVDQQNPIGEHQELPKQDNSKGYVYRIAAESKYACRYKSAGMVNIDTNAKTPAKRNQT